uniref:FKB95-like N-terminal Kelch domain-containing protein n=1 Tax=Davidia involucrata TaxID=16924 RepID=A0A5B6YWF3_DAVIN
MVRHGYLLRHYIGERSRRRKKSLRLFSKMPHNFHHFSGCVAWGHIIYMFGGDYKNPSPEVFYLDVRCPDPGWKRGPPMSVGRTRPYAAVIDGKIYVMGDLCKRPNPWGEVFDPLLNQWKPLPTIPGKEKDDDDHHVSTHAVLKGGKQFLVHPNCSKCLYLYDVEGESWSVFDDHFGSRNGWLETPCVVVDDIMYCFAGRVLAYDLVRRRWFSEPVKGLEGRGVSPPLWEKGYGSLERTHHKAFLVHVGNGKLCLFWHAECEVHCTKFRISKHSDGEEEHKLHAIIESLFVTTIDNAGEIEDCLAL